MGPQPTQGELGLPPSPTSLNPTSPRQDTDDDRHSRRHLPNLFVCLHDLLDPRLGRRQTTRTPSPVPEWGAGESERGIPGERGRGSPTRGGHERGRGIRIPEHSDAPAPAAGPGPEPPGGRVHSSRARPRAHRREPRVVFLLFARHLRESLAVPGPAPPLAASRPRGLLAARPSRFPRVLVPSAPPRRSSRGPSAAVR